MNPPNPSQNPNQNPHSNQNPNQNLHSKSQSQPPSSAVIEKLKEASMSQAINQSLGNYKCTDSLYGNFLIPIIPPSSL